MNYRDLNAINHAFGTLQDSILRARVLDQQNQQRQQEHAERRSERAQDVDFRERELGQRVKQFSEEQDLRKGEDAERVRQFNESESDRKAGEKRQEDRDAELVKHQRAQEAIAQLHQTYQGLEQAVANGTMTAEQANQTAQNIATGIEDSAGAILRASPFGPLKGNKDAKLFTQPDRSPKPYSVTLPSGKVAEGIQTATGTIHPDAGTKPVPPSTYDRLDYEDLLRQRAELTKKVDQGDNTEPTKKALEEINSKMQALRGGAQATPAPGSKGKLDKATAAEFLKQAGGDKEKARQLATAAGYQL